MKLLVTGAVQWDKDYLNQISNLGNEIIYVQDERISLDEQQIDVSEIEGVICNGLFLYNNIEDFINLKYIQLTSAGYDRVPMDYIKDHNIKIYNAKGVYSIPMAEYAVCGVLELYKNTSFFYENKKIKKWGKCRTLLELANKNVLIIGCGNVGIECAKRFKAFDCHVDGVDLYPYKSEVFENIYHLDFLDSELSKCDIIVLTLPLTDETINLFDKSKFLKMKESAVLVNISRGKVVNQNDLIDILKEKKIYGAVLDVFENEPLDKESQLWNMSNVALTPHNSFVGENNRNRLQKVIVHNLKDYGKEKM